MTGCTLQCTEHDSLGVFSLQISRGGRSKGARLEELGFESVPKELDLVESEDQITHQVSLEESGSYNAQINLDVFKVDPDYQENEKKYEVCC